MKSRSQAGWAFATFCARNYTPLILIRDNIGENIGGKLMEECVNRSVRSAFICPYRKQQNYAEGYLRRVTALASYGMVYAGAPMFMWTWSVACAVFINNITASFYSVENTWATPYELTFNEPFQDSSIIVPFCCGVLVLLTDEERGKFQSRCALTIFIHYANQRPLYTYAVYSPGTKRVLYRQDCIFLTNLFPMRHARATEGLCVDGEMIIPYWSPESVRTGSMEELSFKDWDIQQPIPEYQDHISGHHLQQPDHPMFPTDESKPLGYPTVQPNDSRFGPPSVVKVPYQAAVTSGDQTELEQQQLEPKFDIDEDNMHQEKPTSLKRSKPPPLAKATMDSTEPTKALRRPVKQRDGITRLSLPQHWLPIWTI
jgi:hypothetical protein